MGSKFGVRKIAITAALGAVIVALSLSGLDYIPWITGVSLSILQVPVIVGAVIEGPLVGSLVGAIFGITSMIQAVIKPTRGPIDMLFVNPLVSVLPRLCIGLAAWLIFRLFRGKLRPLAAGAAGLVGSLVNTVLVLGALVIGGGIAFPVAAAIAVSNGLLEAAACALLVVGIVSAWKGVEGQLGKARLAAEED